MKQAYLEAITLIERLHRHFLDALRSELDRMGLTDGESYTMHLFFAHRESAGCSFGIRTNVELLNDEAIVTASLPCD